jgi:CyaY protein
MNPRHTPETLSESNFNQVVDDTLDAIETALDEIGSDLDYGNSGGVLTLRCDNGAQIILSRQTPVRQLWVATRTGGFHFERSLNDEWILEGGEQNLGAFIAEALRLQDEEAPDFGTL